MKKNIYIIGGGVSGLIAAQTLENHGFEPTIIESTSSVGGRLKTDKVDNYLLDHGFQVLLTAYPAAQKFLDYEKLNLKEIQPGSIIFKNKKQLTIGDPTRDNSLIIPTLKSNVGSIRDKLKIYTLKNRLQAESLEEIFSKTEMTTLEYLKDLGFSKEIIEMFFRPFYSGIFLEDELRTSSRMFEFVFKMFGEGNAAIPENGIAEIPKQLLNSLKNTEVIYNTKVNEVQENKILLENGDTLNSNYTIIATEASQVIPRLTSQKLNWHSSKTMYFSSKSRVIKKKLIGLIPGDTLINNIFYPNSITPERSGSVELLSVTVVKETSKFSKKELITEVKKELNEYCNIDNLTFIKSYDIPYSLPEIDNIKYTLESTETRLTKHIFLAGDTLLNGSLNAAIISGEKAALGLIKAIN